MRAFQIEYNDQSYMIFGPENMLGNALNYKDKKALAH